MRSAEEAARTLPAILLQVRADKGTGQKPLPKADAADALGVREVTYHQWEKGRRLPDTQRNPGIVERLMDWTDLGELEVLRLLAYGSVPKVTGPAKQARPKRTKAPNVTTRKPAKKSRGNSEVTRIQPLTSINRSIVEDNKAA